MLGPGATSTAPRDSAAEDPPAPTGVNGERAPSAGWSVVAWVLGAWGPAVAVWPPTYVNRTGATSLLVAGALVAVVLRWRPRTAWALPVLLAGAGAVGVALTLPRVGRAPVVVVWILTALAHASLVTWPIEIRAVRDRGRRWLGVPLVLAAGFVWSRSQPEVWTLLLAAVGFGLVEWSRRVPAVARRADATVTGAVLLGRRGIRAAIRLLGFDLAVRYLWGRLRFLVAWVRAPKSRRDRSFIGALAVGALLRGVWAWFMSQDHTEWYSQWNLLYAESFARGRTPEYAGVPTAFWPPAYGLTLAPLQWLNDRWSWLDVHATGAALNVVLGTITVALTGALAARWFGRSARNPAAWIMALALGHVYASSALVGEILAAMLFVLVVLLATIAVDRGPSVALPAFVALGLLIGYPALVKDFAFLLFLVPALCVRGRRGSWRGSLRITLATAAGVVLVLGPWAIRNGTEVGVWSPFSTVNSDSLCWTRYKLDMIQYETKGTDIVTYDMFADCNRNSPLMNPDGFYATALPDRPMPMSEPDESAWAQRQSREFVKFALREPLYLLKMAPLRIYNTAGNDDTGGLSLATQSTEVTIAGPLAMRVYGTGANAWYFAVVGLALVGLVRLRSARAAVPIWGIALFLALYTIPGPRALTRHYFIAYPFLAILAAAAFAAVGAVGQQTPPAEGSAAAGDAPVDDLERTSG